MEFTSFHIALAVLLFGVYTVLTLLKVELTLTRRFIIGLFCVFIAHIIKAVLF